MFSLRFSYENIIDTYNVAKKGKLSTGRDRISRYSFNKRHEEILRIASEKILNNSYKPIAYKEVLLLKNKDLKPRVLSIPSIRDNIIIDVIKDKLKAQYEPSMPIRTVNEIVRILAAEIEINKFDSYIKLDISSYYDSIDHNILLSKLADLGLDQNFVDLINMFIKNPTLSEFECKSKSSFNVKGVPQGIAISNILGSIYLDDFDKNLLNDGKIMYIRYVDDIIIFCCHNDIEKNIYKAELELKKHSLALNSKKTLSGKIDRFTFLGYDLLQNGSVSIAQKNIHRMESSLEKIFSDYVSSSNRVIKDNIKLLIWKTNLKITGCFKGGKRYGWVIFFCENDDETILHRLDWLVKKLCYRFNLNEKLIYNKEFTGKSFVKTYKEFNSKKDNTDYITNFDNFTRNDKVDVLINICKMRKKIVYSMSDYTLDREFDKFVFKSIKDIERDLHQIYL